MVNKHNWQIDSLSTVYESEHSVLVLYARCTVCGALAAFKTAGECGGVYGQGGSVEIEGILLSQHKEKEEDSMIKDDIKRYETNIAEANAEYQRLLSRLRQLPRESDQIAWVVADLNCAQSTISFYRERLNIALNSYEKENKNDV